MAISIDWASGVITVPKDYTTLVQLTPTEVRDLDTNQFRLDLKNLEDDPDGMPFTKTHDHNPPVSVGGIELARVISITDDYTVTFEDGLWAVNLKGSNNNILDRNNKNQVSLNPGNSAGLVTSEAIEFSEYGDKVTLDVLNITGKAVSGSIYPIGTLRRPSNNSTDTVLIANSKGFSKIKVISDCTFDVTADFNYFTIEGLSHVQTKLTILTASNVLGVTIKNIELTGVLDGESEVRNCIIKNVSYFNGHIHDCSLGGTITLGGNVETLLDDCSRLEGGVVPVIDFNNGNNYLTMPNYSGLIELENITDLNVHILIGLNNGTVKLNSLTTTAGSIQVDGIGYLLDENDVSIETGTWNGMTIINNTVSNDSMAKAVWEHTSGEIVKKMLYNRVTKSGDIITIYEDDSVTVWEQFDLANDGRVEV